MRKENSFWDAKFVVNNWTKLLQNERVWAKLRMFELKWTKQTNKTKKV